MQRRRAIPGVKARCPLRDQAEYSDALAELHRLGQEALGTPKTRGLQQLVDCILAYELAQSLSGDGFVDSISASKSGRVSVGKERRS